MARSRPNQRLEDKSPEPTEPASVAASEPTPEPAAERVLEVDPSPELVPPELAPPEPTPEPVLVPVPEPAPESAPAPPPELAPPSIPRRPRRARGVGSAELVQAQAPPQTPPSGRRLPTDPAARAAARSAATPVAAQIIATLDVVLSIVPPSRPLSPEERALVEPAMIDATAVYLGGDLDPLVGLAIALATIAISRVVELRMRAS